MSIVPIRDLWSRPPEQGRLRYGVKTAKAMKAISTWRATSSDRAAIEQFAELYGGKVEPFDSGRGVPGWEVVSDASEIPVILPPDPLGSSPVYELWSGGGCLRRCDGETCEMDQSSPEGATKVSVPCICAKKGSLECKPMTRLSVILPDIRFGGTWRMEAKGWNAAHELPGMVSMIQALQERGLSRALLALERRTSTKAGQTRKFIVPVLRLAETPDAILAGAASVHGLAASPTMAIGAGSEAVVRADDDPVDADIVVGWEEVAADGVDDAVDAVVPGGSDAEIVDAEVVFDVRRAQSHMFGLFATLGIDKGERSGWALTASRGRTRRTSELTEQEFEQLLDALERIHNDQLVYKGLDDRGFARVAAR